jgi:Fur family ferric uptake transcriptional regulator
MGWLRGEGAGAIITVDNSPSAKDPHQQTDPMTTPSQVESPVPKITTKPPTGCAMLMMDLFRSYLHQHHLPLTHQREAIAMALFESERHLSVDDLESRLRGSNEHVGKATVYRTVNLLVEAELARELDFGEGFKRYEHQAGEARHDHLICTGCGKVIRFSRAALDELQEQIAADLGFVVQSRRLKLYGLCGDCQASGSEGAATAGTPTGIGVGLGPETG